MTTTTLTPPCVALDDAIPTLQRQGYAVLSAPSVFALTQTDLTDLMALVPSWNELPPDQYLKDGGRYRRRRHASYVIQDGQLQAVAHRAHWQPLEYNALHGGMQRWFDPMEPATVGLPVWQRILVRLGEAVSALHGARPWYVEAHPFRIDTTDGIGRPTPEGAHRDGVDLVAVFMLERHAIKGGESRVFEAAGPAGQRFTLREPWSLLLLDDARVIHETTPIQPLVTGELGWRDTLVLTYRRGGFQGEGADAGQKGAR